MSVTKYIQANVKVDLTTPISNMQIALTSTDGLEHSSPMTAKRQKRYEHVLKFLGHIRMKKMFYNRDKNEFKGRKTVRYHLVIACQNITLIELNLTFFCFHISIIFQQGTSEIKTCSVLANQIFFRAETILQKSYQSK